MISKSQRSILIMLVCSYMAFAVSTFLNVEFFIELFSTLTAGFTAGMILLCLDGMKEFHYPALLISLGIFCWTGADLIRFINHYILNREPLSLAVRTLYLLPNYFFGVSLSVYIVKKLAGRRRELSYLMANAFCVSGIGFVLLWKLLTYFSNGNDVSVSTQIRAMLYFLINFFVILLVMHLFRLVGTDGVKRGTNLLPLGILCYILLDIQYNMKEASGQEPENIYTNLLYMLFMIMMAVGILIQRHRQYVYFFGVSDFSARAIRMRIIYTVAALAANIAALAVGFLKLEEALYIIILLMAYMIMTYISRTDLLNETLLEQQMQQNIVLEEKVEEKTRELKKTNEYLEHLSATDLLTGLYNRRYGYDYLAALHRECVEGKSGYAVFCIDLNHFKPINDTYGHEMGDRVLKEFSKRMLALPDHFISVRTGGDEFMIVMKRDGADVDEAAEQLQTLFHTPILLDTYVFHLSASIGVSCFPEDADNTTALIQYADAAMYVIKHSGHKDGYRRFDSSLVTDVLRNQEIKNQLATADPEKDFVLQYQPQVDVATGHLVGVEVFPHLTEHEEISPAVLIPLAEEIGLMNQLGIWIVRTAAVQIRKWEEVNGRQLHMTINLSPLQLIDNAFIDFLEHIEDNVGIVPQRVMLDVDNEVIMGSVSTAKQVLKRLHQKGFMISLNNFGGDDINLSYVMDCGFDGVKLSRSLVSGSVTDERALQLVHSIIAIADSFDMEVTAVGIETEEQVNRMRELGISKMQGYRFGWPVLAEDFEI